MTLSAEFIVEGVPRPKERARRDPRSGRWYTPRSTVAYQRIVAAQALMSSRWIIEPDGALRRRDVRWPSPSDCERERPRPRGSRSPRCACDWCSAEWVLELRIYLPDRRTRDVDNIEKAILDACNGILWRDDRQALVERKSREVSRDSPRVEVYVRRREG